MAGQSSQFVMLPFILVSVSSSLSFCCFIKSWLEYPGFKESLLLAVQTAFVIFFMLHFQQSPLLVDPFKSVFKTHSVWKRETVALLLNLG